MPCCGICLEEEADAPPPCGGQWGAAAATVETHHLRFHRRCLDRACLVQAPNFRCPHCNRALDTRTGAAAAIRAAVSGWLQEEGGTWTQTPVYVQLKDSLIKASEGAELAEVLVREVCNQLSAALPQGSETQVVHSDSVISFLRRSDRHATAIHARRSASVNQDGSFLSDGFLLCGQRYRSSPRAEPTAPPRVPLNF